MHVDLIVVSQLDINITLHNHFSLSIALSLTDTQFSALSWSCCNFVHEKQMRMLCLVTWNYRYLTLNIFHEFCGHFIENTTAICPEKCVGLYVRGILYYINHNIELVHRLPNVNKMWFHNVSLFSFCFALWSSLRTYSEAYYHYSRASRATTHLDLS